MALSGGKSTVPTAGAALRAAEQGRPVDPFQRSAATVAMMFTYSKAIRLSKEGEAGGLQGPSAGVLEAAAAGAGAVGGLMDRVKSVFKK